MPPGESSRYDAEVMLRNPRVLRIVLWILGSAGMLLSVAFFVFLKGPFPAARAFAVTGLWQLGPRAAPAMELYLEDSDREGVRHLAVQALIAWDGDASTPWVDRFLQDEDPVVRLWAATSVRERKRVSLAPLLIPLLSDPDLEVRTEVVHGIRALGVRDAVPALNERLSYEEDGIVQMLVVEALGELGDASLVPRLLPFLGWEGGTRNVAQNAICKLGDKSLVPTLIDLLGSPNANVRGGAIDLLGTFADASSAPQVVGFLGDPDPLVRDAASSTLTQWGDVSVAPGILALIAKPDSGVYVDAAEALESLGGRFHLPRLFELLDSPSPRVRWLAVDAVKRIGGRSEIPRVVERLDDPNLNVREYAASCVAQLAGQRWGSDVEAAKIWWGVHGEDPEFAPVR